MTGFPTVAPANSPPVATVVSPPAVPDCCGWKPARWCRKARANPRQLWIHANNVRQFAQLVEDARRAALEIYGPSHHPRLVLQLTHSGRYSRPGRHPSPIIAHHSKFLDPIHKLPADYPLITDEDLEQLEDEYVNAARCAYDAGFDAVDVKACHRYLISELHASFTRENSRYGGPTWENRTRLFRNIVGKIHQQVPGIAITSRMNAYDAMEHPYGWGVSRDDMSVPDLAEPIRLIEFLQRAGAPLVNITIGNPYFNPFVNRPFDLPTAGAPLPPEHPLEGVSRFVHVVREIQQRLPQPGHHRRRLLMAPPVPAEPRRGHHRTRLDVACRRRPHVVRLSRFARATSSKKDASIRSASAWPARPAPRSCATVGRSGCVPRDADIYEPIYKAGRAEALDTIQAMAATCRQCNDPTCVPKCPAHVNVPKFISEISASRSPASATPTRPSAEPMSWPPCGGLRVPFGDSVREHMHQ